MGTGEHAKMTQRDNEDGEPYAGAANLGEVRERRARHPAELAAIAPRTPASALSDVLASLSVEDQGKVLAFAQFLHHERSPKPRDLRLVQQTPDATANEQDRYWTQLRRRRQRTRPDEDTWIGRY
jgi:hypothetical protein